MPKVSVILPVYNGQEFLEDTINMLCNSTMKDIEIIVVDDGSKDDSYKIMHMCAKKDSRIKIFKKDNEGGVYSARNYGLKKASGEYICFCDQDDVIKIDMYEKMYKKAHNGLIDVVMCSTGKFISGKYEEFEKLPDLVFDTREKICEIILGNLFANTNLYFNKRVNICNTVWKCMVKKDFLENNNIIFRKYINYEDDWLFILDVLARAKNVVTMSEILYYWKINLKSETYNSSYVFDMYIKDKKLQKEVEYIARIAGIEEEIIEVYHKHYNCTRYINLIENEQKRKKVALKNKMAEISIIKTESDFKQSLLMRRYYKKNMIRKVIALNLLDSNLLYVSYLFLFLFHKIKLVAISNRLWTKLENKLERL